jgi:DNA-directed RNA polymerase specialized sigma24 family protein
MPPSLNRDLPHLHQVLNSVDHTRFEKIYDQYAPAMYGWILRRIPDVHSAEEILYRSFQKVIQSLDQYQPEKCGFLSWLIQISNKEIQLYNSGLKKVLIKSTTN